METSVLIVGAGPAGLATSVCLSDYTIPTIILEREDCHASLWKHRSYNRLHLHVAKKFCELPHFPHLPNTPTFMSRADFIEYIDNYVSNFNLKPLFSRCVKSAFFYQTSKKWIVEAKNAVSGEIETYIAKFLVVATGENAQPFIPKVRGIESFCGNFIHSSQYKCGDGYQGKHVLVVGCGNSGMEIGFDLSNFGARTSIVVRSPFHIVTKEMIYMGMRLLKYLPMWIVDYFIILWSRIVYGNLSEFGLHLPSRGPFTHKLVTGKTPVIDVGTAGKIRSGEIQVVPEIINVNGNMVKFKDGTQQYFDEMVFATGYKSAANDWLKDYHFILNEDGMPKNPLPNHWKGENGVYCVGLSGGGINGISRDAMLVANDISFILNRQRNIH